MKPRLRLAGCMNTEANLNIIYTSGAAGGYRVDIMMTSAKQYLKPRRQRKKQFFVHEKLKNRAKNSNVTLNWTVVNLTQASRSQTGWEQPRSDNWTSSRVNAHIYFELQLKRARGRGNCNRKFIYCACSRYALYSASALHITSFPEVALYDNYTCTPQDPSIIPV